MKLARLENGFAAENVCGQNELPGNFFFCQFVIFEKGLLDGSERTVEQEKPVKYELSVS